MSGLMKFDFGNEKKFVEFVKGISRKDKVALISHTDLDGIAAAKIANEILKSHFVKFVNYDQIAQPLVEELKREGVNKIVFTDLYIKHEEFILALEEFAEVLIMDHHLADRDWNSKRTTFVKIEEGYCAGYLCYVLFSKIKDIEYLDWLAACSCVSDYCHIKPAAWLESVFEKYGDSFEQVGRYVRTSGVMWDLQETFSLAIIYFKDDLKSFFDKVSSDFGDLGELKVCADEVRQEVEHFVNLFEKKKEAFPDGYLFEFNPNFRCGSIVGTIISGKYEHKTVITLRFDPEKKMYGMSGRRQDKKVNMNDFLKKLVEGFERSEAGGHVAAAGGLFPAKYLAEFKNRLGVVS